MAGVFIDISGDALEKLQLLRHKSTAPEDVLDDIGAFLDMDVTTRFLNELAPDGTRWEQSKAAVERGGLTLTDQRNLAGSVTHNVEGDELVHGLGEEYAAIHHFGGKTGRGHVVTLPARPILGIEQYQAGVIVETLTGWLV
ncbi:phage virion morphogenesis protein [Pseudoalteromonas luteoviolacea]|uniref:phage virion morphogenesis protein n=1 Tax=Pseudoalteromonas luteoviolacea TaxID=43657 RepID=UPI001B360327|nr:phage virion morphogenesis protein [Pseudoalteromonas luteoviolacea]MBQ4840030.1 phage virion morphogenesis protein [Pseudoalteromonas luteoviolacea]